MLELYVVRPYDLNLESLIKGQLQPPATTSSYAVVQLEVRVPLHRTLQVQDVCGCSQHLACRRHLSQVHGNQDTSCHFSYRLGLVCKCSVDNCCARDTPLWGLSACCSCTTPAEARQAWSLAGHATIDTSWALSCIHVMVATGAAAELLLPAAHQGRRCHPHQAGHHHAAAAARHHLGPGGCAGGSGPCILEGANPPGADRKAAATHVFCLHASDTSSMHRQRCVTAASSHARGCL